MIMIAMLQTILFISRSHINFHYTKRAMSEWTGQLTDFVVTGAEKMPMSLTNSQHQFRDPIRFGSRNSRCKHVSFSLFPAWILRLSEIVEFPSQLLLHLTFLHSRWVWQNIDRIVPFLYAVAIDKEVMLSIQKLRTRTKKRTNSLTECSDAYLWKFYSCWLKNWRTCRKFCNQTKAMT